MFFLVCVGWVVKYIYCDWRFSSSSLEITWLSMSLQLKGIIHMHSDVGGAPWSSAAWKPHLPSWAERWRAHPVTPPPLLSPHPPPPTATSTPAACPLMSLDQDCYRAGIPFTKTPVSFSNSAPHTITVVLWQDERRCWSYIFPLWPWLDHKAQVICKKYTL